MWQTPKREHLWITGEGLYRLDAVHVSIQQCQSAEWISNSKHKLLTWKYHPLALPNTRWSANWLSSERNPAPFHAGSVKPVSMYMNCVTTASYAVLLHFACIFDWIHTGCMHRSMTDIVIDRTAVDYFLKCSYGDHLCVNKIKLGIWQEVKEMVERWGKNLIIL